MAARTRNALLMRVVGYYLFLITLLLVAAFKAPDALRYLPFGGLGSLVELDAHTGLDSLAEKMLLASRSADALVDSFNLFSAMIGTLIVMLPLRRVYLFLQQDQPSRPAVASSLLVLPLVVTAIVYVVRFSLPLAFALAGIFAGVRYRTTLKNQADAFFTFASIGVGLAAGTRSLGIALVLALFFGATVLLAPPWRAEAGVGEED